MGTTLDTKLRKHHLFSMISIFIEASMTIQDMLYVHFLNSFKRHNSYKNIIAKVCLGYLQGFRAKCGGRCKSPHDVLVRRELILSTVSSATSASCISTSCWQLSLITYTTRPTQMKMRRTMPITWGTGGVKVRLCLVNTNIKGIFLTILAEQCRYFSNSADNGGAI